MPGTRGRGSITSASEFWPIVKLFAIFHLFHSSVGASGPSKLQSFLYLIAFLSRLLADLSARNHGIPSTTPLSVLNFPKVGLPASMLITHRSSPVITIRPIEVDGPSFRTLGRNERVCLLLGDNTIFNRAHFQLESACSWLSFLCWKSDLPEYSDDFSSFPQHKRYSISQVPEPRYWGLTSPGSSWCTVKFAREAGRIKGHFPFQGYVSRALWSTLPVACNQDFLFGCIPRHWQLRVLAAVQQGIRHDHRFQNR